MILLYIRVCAEKNRNLGEKVCENEWKMKENDWKMWKKSRIPLSMKISSG